ncbi:MAG: carbohydrate kinase family protein [Candidatus Eremiobacteraeota bacterium]|nr:carbohydrate kinase family protein [Candidatus Eremiobacteraeota bacterium]
MDHISIVGSVCYDVGGIISKAVGGKIFIGPEILRSPGGALFHTARYLGSQNLSVAVKTFVALEKDVYGEMIKKELKEQGMDISHLKEVEMSTNFSVFALDPETAERIIIVIEGAIRKYEMNFKDYYTIGKSRAVFLTHSYAEDSREQIKEIARICQKKNPIFCQMGKTQYAFGMEFLSNIAQKVTSIQFNEDEARQVLNIKNNPTGVQLATRLVEELPGVPIINLTFGNGGSITYDRRTDSFHTSGIHVVDSVNSVGAGDIFFASFNLEFLLSGGDTQKALLTARASAAQKTTGEILKRDEVAGFQKKYPALPIVVQAASRKAAA